MDQPPKLLSHYAATLQAIDAGRNVARTYRILMAPDLFGHVIVELSWGRIGRKLSRISVSFPSADAARRFVKRTLARRETAPRRIGVAYEFIEQTLPRCGA